MAEGRSERDQEEALSTAPLEGGELSTWRRASTALGRPTVFRLFRPLPSAARPTVLYLGDGALDPDDAGAAAIFDRAWSHGLNVAAPETIGPTACEYGFWVDALQPPFDRDHRHFSYLVDELPRQLEALPWVAPGKFGLLGHGAGGHAALVACLRNPLRVKSASCFSPLAAPLGAPSTRNAFTRLFGANDKASKVYDPATLVAGAGWRRPILVDYGHVERPFPPPWGATALVESFKKAGAPLRCLMHHGYDQGPDLVARFADDHLAHHKKELVA